MNSVIVRRMAKDFSLHVVCFSVMLISILNIYAHMHAHACMTSKVVHSLDSQLRDGGLCDHVGHCV